MTNLINEVGKLARPRHRHGFVAQSLSSPGDKILDFGELNS